MILQCTSVECRPASSEFLLLPPEIRQLVYHDILSHQSIVLRDKLSTPYIGSRRHWQFYLDHKHGYDDTISLLQLCQQICSEVRPLLQYYSPSCLILSKDIHQIPAIPRQFLDHLNLPTAYITYLAINVKILGENAEEPRECPGMQSDIDWMSIPCTYSFRSLSEEDVCPPEPNRLPNLKHLYQISDFISNSLPALRELHIYDVLKHSLRHLEPCCCPIAGTESCVCGACQCKCISHRPLPTSKELSALQVENLLYVALLSRYSAALPKWHCSEDTQAGISSHMDCFSFFDLLGHGVHVFLHDEVTITAPLHADPSKTLYKGCWNAIYHIGPTEDAKTPANSSMGVSHELDQKNQTDRTESLEDRGGDLMSRFLAYDHEKIRDLPAGVKEQPNMLHTLHLRNLDGHSFDNIVENSSQQANMDVNGTNGLGEKCQTHWKWG